MPKMTNAGGVLTDAEEAEIAEAIVSLRHYVAAHVPTDMQPHDLTGILFKVVDHVYAVKATIDRVTKAANLRLWRSNVHEFRRGVSPRPKTTEERMTDLGIQSKEELRAILIELGLRDPDNGSVA